MNRILQFCAALLVPPAASAHPHVFVEASVTLVFDEEGDLSVRLNWQYDELFSLLVTSDFGLDMDGDLVLTAAEQTVLEREIAAWPDDFAGDLEVMQGEALLTLGAKQGHEMVYEDGLFIERHLRPVADVPDLSEPLRIRVYDPAFYTAYDLMRPVTVEGRDDCAVEVISADLDAAYALAAELTGNIDFSSDGPDDYFPAIGDAFADTIVLTCA
ncbi:MAG: DUF1007 family protein [Pseudomonadota bacterium]